MAHTWALVSRASMVTLKNFGLTSTTALNDRRGEAGDDDCSHHQPRHLVSGQTDSSVRVVDTRFG